MSVRSSAGGEGPKPIGRYPYPTSETWRKAEAFIEHCLEREGWTPKAFEAFVTGDLVYAYGEWARARERELAEEARKEERTRDLRRARRTLRRLAGKGRR